MASSIFTYFSIENSHIVFWPRVLQKLDMDRNRQRLRNEIVDVLQEPSRNKVYEELNSPANTFRKAS